MKVKSDESFIKVSENSGGDGISESDLDMYLKKKNNLTNIH